MRSRIVGGLVAFGALLVPLLATNVASAQYGQPDGARFRGGIGLDAGALIFPGYFVAGQVGVGAQLGVQINHNWGVYAVPELHLLVASNSEGFGLSASAAVAFDYTFDAAPVSVGAGVEAGDIVPFLSLYGARLHAAYYPVLVRGDYNPSRRKALYIAFDLHIDGVSLGNVTDTGGALVFVSPMLGVGYQAF